MTERRVNPYVDPDTSKTLFRKMDDLTKTVSSLDKNLGIFQAEIKAKNEHYDETLKENNEQIKSNHEKLRKVVNFQRVTIALAGVITALVAFWSRIVSTIKNI